MNKTYHPRHGGMGMTGEHTADSGATGASVSPNTCSVEDAYTSNDANRPSEDREHPLLTRTGDEINPTPADNTPDEPQAHTNPTPNYDDETIRQQITHTSGDPLSCSTNLTVPRRARKSGNTGDYASSEQTSMPSDERAPSDTNLASSAFDPDQTTKNWTLLDRETRLARLEALAKPHVGRTANIPTITSTLQESALGSHVPDSVVDSVTLSDSVQVGVVSVKGVGHHQYSAPRQDAYSIGSDDSWVVIAIADGVSEAKYSHVAASLAVRKVVSESLTELNGLPPNGVDAVDWPKIADHVRDTILKAGRQNMRLSSGSDVSDDQIAASMATTCDVLVAPRARGEGPLCVWRIHLSGDGSFYLLDQKNGWSLLNSSKDTQGDNISNIVNDALPRGGGDPEMYKQSLVPGQAAMLCTDGFGDSIRDGSTPVAEFTAEVWQRPLDTVQLLWSASFWNAVADDDRTAAIIWCTA